MAILSSRRENIGILYLLVTLVTLICIVLDYIIEIQSVLNWRCSDWRICLLLLFFNPLSSKVLQIPSTSITCFEILNDVTNILGLSYCVQTTLVYEWTLHWVIYIWVFLNFHNLLFDLIVAIFQSRGYFDLSFSILKCFITLIGRSCYLRTTDVRKQEIILSGTIDYNRVFI